MSNVAERIDARESLNQWLGQLKGMYIADLKAMPAQTITESAGGVARPVNVLTGDAAGLCVWLTAVLRGETPPMDENYADGYAQYTTNEQLIDAFSAAVDGFSSALMAADEALLQSTVMTPWGMETQIFMLSQIAVSHIWYHDGQLNMIQALNGDGAVHWMD